MIRDLETVVRNLVMSGKLGFTVEDLIIGGKTNLAINDLFESKLDDEDPYGPKKSCLNWFGGKAAFVEQIAALSPPDICINSYIEVFGGAGHHILYRKNMTKAQKGDKNLNKSRDVYNDLNGGLYTVFKVIQDDDKYERLCDMLYKTPYNREVFESCKDWESREDDVELAWAFMVRHLQAINTSGGFAAPTEIVGKGENAYRKKVKMFEDKTRTNLRALKEKVDSFIVENYDFEACIDKYDAEDAFFLLDPPYVPQTRTAPKVYDKEMSVEDHERLVDKLLNMKGYVMLCGYDNDIYKRLEDNGFQKVLLGRTKRSSSNTNRDEVKEEYVWLNYKTFDGILSYFVCEEAISSFAKLGKLVKDKLITWDEIPECKDIKFTRKKEQATPATEDRIKKLEKKFNITLPEGYYRFLMEFNGGYIKKRFSDKTELKPAYFFGILNQEHPMDLGTQINNMPQLRIDGGFIPIGVTTENDFICLKVSKTLIPTVNDLASYEDVYGVEPIIAIYRKTGEVEYFKRSLQELFGDLYREYRGYKSVTSKKVTGGCMEIEEFSSEYCMSLVDEVNNSLCYLHSICKELLSELPKKDLKLFKKSFLFILKEMCNKQDFKSLKLYFLHAYKSSTEEFRSENEALVPQILLYLRDDGAKSATDKLFELSKIPKEDYSILLKNCLTLIKSKGYNLFDEDITLSIFQELLPGLSDEALNSIKNIVFSFMDLSKEEMDSIDEIVNKVCYMHNLSKELLYKLSEKDFNLLKDTFLSTMSVLAFDKELDDIEDFEDDIKLFSEVYNLPAKAFELYMKCICLPEIVFDENTVSIVKNILFQLSKLPKEEYSSLLDKCLDLIKTGLSYLSKEEFIERIEVSLPLTICVLSKKFNIDLKDLIRGGEVNLDDIPNDSLEDIYKDIDWVKLSIEDIINFIDVFLSVTKATIKPSFINFTGTFISIVKSAVRSSLLEKEVELLKEIESLLDEYPLSFDDEAKEELKPEVVELRPGVFAKNYSNIGEAFLKDSKEEEYVDEILCSCIEELNEVYPEETTLKIIKEFLLSYNGKKVRREVIQDLNEYVYSIKSLLSCFK